MYQATATVLTDRASRYRDQLASHGAGMMRHGRKPVDGHTPPQVHETNLQDHTLVLDLAWGRCRITATERTLEIVAEANSLEDLAKITAGIANRIQKIGRRDGLTVVWSEANVAEPDHQPIARPRRSSAAIVAVVVIAVLAVAAHVGLLAAAWKHGWT